MSIKEHSRFLVFCFEFILVASALFVAACGGSQSVAPTAPSRSWPNGIAVPQPSPHLIVGCPSPSPSPLPSASAAVDHVTIVMMENHSYSEIIGNAQASYINSLATGNALLTNSFAVTHPSEPNYLAIYSGSTQGITDDSCPHTFAGPSLGGELIGAGKTIRGYMEDLPQAGSTVCSSGHYQRSHDPLIDFSDTPAASVVPYTQIATDIASNTYPNVAFIVPNLLDDMHDGSIAMGDAWLAAHLPPILAYNATHKGLLILTWDEDDATSANHIATIVVGPMVKAGNNGQLVNHYNVLRTVTDVFQLSPLNPAGPIPGLF